LNQRDKAVEAWKKVYEAHSESDAAPGAYFKVFDVLNEKKDYPAALKLMEDFVAKYPKHENVYFAYNNIAEFLFSGALDSKKGAGGGQTSLANVEAGAKKLLDYVDYEITNKLEKKRGEGSLIKIADRWLKELAKLPPYLTLNETQKQTWQKSVDGVIGAVERLLKDYAGSERIAEALERLVTVENVRRKAQQADAATVEAYFKKLTEEFGKTPLVKAKLEVALASFLADSDPKRAFGVMDEAFRTVPQSAKVKDADGTERIAATFTPSDFDRYMGGLFEAKRNDDLTKNIARIRQEYPLGEKDDLAKAPHNVLDAQAVALFWEAKLLQEQGKTAEAGAKFAGLKAKFPKSTKALEADYGVILGEFEQTGQPKDDYIQRLSKVVNTQTGKSFALQAKALFLVGRVQEAKKDFDGAIETYEKIQVRYASVPQVAASGLWKAAELAEKQAKGESGYPVKTKQEKRAAAEARAAEQKAAKANAKPDEAKPTEAKPGDEKPGEPKKAPAKPAPKPAAANPPQK
jgi:tetratricopeptide (TPR) repeat protein